MRIDDYFAQANGVGVLSTADSNGRVDSAVYARPNITEDGSIVFIMRDRLTHHNLQQNPYASFLFIEKGHGYKGLRLFLKKEREDTDLERIQQMTRRCLSPEEDEAKGPKFLVYFKAEKVLDLVGSEVPDITIP